jgi:hypothetical protein
MAIALINRRARRTYRQTDRQTDKQTDKHPVADTHPVAVVISHITYGRTVKVDYSSFSWEGLHGKQVVATGKGKTGTIPTFAVGRATWEACSGNWERKKGTIPAFAVGRATWEACSGNWERKKGTIPTFAVGRAPWEA